MDFEFDLAKSEANWAKHGIDFVAAQELWSVWSLEKALPLQREPRWMRIVLFDERFWAIVYTMRGNRIRLISVRRARKEEVFDYDVANRGRFGHDPQS